MRIINKQFFLSTLLFLAILLSGCAGIKEVCKGIAGVSTQVLEDTRKDGLSQVIGYDLLTCHNKIKSILKEEGAYIYADDLSKDMLALYISEEDTTPVGVFLTEKSKGSTLVEVSSPSTYGKETISNLLFDTLNRELKGEPKKGHIDAVKTKTKTNKIR